MVERRKISFWKNPIVLIVLSVVITVSVNTTALKVTNVFNTPNEIHDLKKDIINQVDKLCDKIERNEENIKINRNDNEKLKKELQDFKLELKESITELKSTAKGFEKQLDRFEKMLK